MKRTKRSEGSLLANGRRPEPGSVVWVLALDGKLNERPLRGLVERVDDIDGKGLGNTYVTVATRYYGAVRVNLSRVFGHRPRLVAVVDEFGPVEVWR